MGQTVLLAVTNPKRIPPVALPPPATAHCPLPSRHPHCYSRGLEVSMHDAQAGVQVVHSLGQIQGHLPAPAGDQAASQQGAACGVVPAVRWFGTVQLATAGCLKACPSC